MHVDIVFDEWNLLSIVADKLLESFGGTCRTAEIKSLGSIEKFDAEHRFNIIDNMN